MAQNARRYHPARTTDGARSERLIHNRVAALGGFGPDSNHVVAQRQKFDLLNRGSLRSPDKRAEFSSGQIRPSRRVRA